MVLVALGNSLVIIPGKLFYFRQYIVSKVLAIHVAGTMALPIYSMR